MIGNNIPISEIPTSAGSVAQGEELLESDRVPRVLSALERLRVLEVPSEGGTTYI